jgi:hypothetical protein
MTRIVSASRQSVLKQGEDFYLRIRILSEAGNLSGRLCFRKLGEKDYSVAEIKRLASNVFEVRIPANVIPEDFEYYIEVNAGEEKILYPVTAGDINLPVILLN